MADETLDLGDDDSTPRDLRTRFTQQYRDQGKALNEERAARESAERRLALIDAGLGTLDETKRDALLAVHKGEMNAEALKGTANLLGFLQQEQNEQPPGDTPGHQAAQRQAQVTQSTTAGSSSTTTQITPDEVAKWPIDRLMAFGAKYPWAQEMLLRGESVNASDLTT